MKSIAIKGMICIMWPDRVASNNGMQQIGGARLGERFPKETELQFFLNQNNPEAKLV